MRRSYTVEAIVLKRKDSGEADRLVTLFTRQRGKFHALAKGVRRIHSRRAAHIEQFSRVHLVITERTSFSYIGEATQVQSYSLLRKKLERATLGYIACELTDRLTADYQEHELIFFELATFLENLCQNDLSRSQAHSLLHSYKEKLLIELGFSAITHTLTPEKIDGFIQNLIEGELTSKKMLTKITLGEYNNSKTR